MINHKKVAEDYLAQAAALVDTPRIGVARTLAEVAQAHATLALVDAVLDVTTPPVFVPVEDGPRITGALMDAARRNSDGVIWSKDAGATS